MHYTTLGGSDLKVSRVCLGTMPFGTQNSEADAHQQLDFVLVQGINFIDTAEMYSVPPNAESYGKTERYVGTWLKRQVRDRIVLATKISGPGRSMKWIRNGELAFNRKNIRAAIEASLARLQTDYVDCRASILRTSRPKDAWRYSRASPSAIRRSMCSLPSPPTSIWNSATA